MRHFPCLTASSMIALIAASPAVADITADDVWTNTKAPIEAMGGSISAETARDGNVMTVGDMTIQFVLPFDAGTINAVMSGMILTENSDGSVAITYPSNLTGKFSVESNGSELASITLGMTSDVYMSQANGEPGDITYDYTVSGASFRLGDVNVPEAPDVDIDMTGTMSGMEGSYRITEGELLRIEASGSNGDMGFEMEMTDEFGIESVSSQTMSGGTNEMVMTIPTGKLSILNLAQGLKDGLSLELEGEGGRIEARSTSRMNGEVILVQNYGYVSEEISYVVNEDTLEVEGTNSDIWFDMVADLEFPFPIKGSIDEVSAYLSMPLNATDGPEDAGLELSFTRLEVDEALWGMFDPQEQLPRDPANLYFELSGEIELLMDLLNIEALMQMGPDDGVPIRLHTLEIEDFGINLVGADLRGSGEFTFDNDDLETFDGLPAPDGSIDLDLSGANTLMDTLVSMGFLPEEQAAGARMMMGLFAVPGDGEDTLTSTIEVKPDGQVIANGQRLR